MNLDSLCALREVDSMIALGRVCCRWSSSDRSVRSKWQYDASVSQSQSMSVSQLADWCRSSRPSQLVGRLVGCRRIDTVDHQAFWRSNICGLLRVAVHGHRGWRAHVGVHGSGSGSRTGFLRVSRSHPQCLVPKH
jgi:hypothetical protein